MKRKPWEQSYKEFIKYVKINGTQHIRINDKENELLKKWITCQRQGFQKGVLSNEKVKLLNDFNFEFHPDETRWNYWYNVLIENRNFDKIDNIPFRYKRNRFLGIWLYNQKRRYKKGTLPLDRQLKLRAADINWIDL